MAADILPKFADWLASEPSNLPGNSFSVKKLADNLRQTQGTMRTELGTRGTIVSAATVDLSTVDAGAIDVTGATGPITSFGTLDAGIRKRLRFTDGGQTITRNATSLETITAADIVVAAGDQCEVESGGSGNWFMVWYERADGSTTQVNSGATITRQTKTGNYTLATSDKASAIDMTGSWTLTFAVMTAGWWVILNNAGTGDITMSGSMDGVSNPVIYPGEVRQLFADGSSILLQGGSKTYSSVGTFTWKWPPKATWADVTVIGGAGGGSGGVSAAGSGGGGGGGGGVARTRYRGVAGGTACTLNVGAGGSAGSLGNQGGDGSSSTFDVGGGIGQITGTQGLRGGAGQAGGGASTAGTAGTGSLADANSNSGAGGSCVGTGAGSPGGSSLRGCGGGGSGGGSVSGAAGTGGTVLGAPVDSGGAGGNGGAGGFPSASPGTVGTAPGGGGGGGGSSTGTGAAGAAGAAGAVRIQWG